MGELLEPGLEFMGQQFRPLTGLPDSPAGRDVRNHPHGTSHTPPHLGHSTVFNILGL